jgi:hypothetical protein
MALTLSLVEFPIAGQSKAEHQESQEAPAPKVVNACRQRRRPGERPSVEEVTRAEQPVRLDNRLSTVLDGKAQPKDAAERLGFAPLCQQHRKPYNAACSGARRWRARTGSVRAVSEGV